MTSLAFAVPFDGEKMHHLLDHLDGHIHGDGRAETHAATTAKGLTHVRFYHQPAPQDLLIVYLEGPRLDQTLAQMRTTPGRHEDQWAQLMQMIGGTGEPDLADPPA